jgi:hypothetical protein
MRRTAASRNNGRTIGGTFSRMAAPLASAEQQSCSTCTSMNMRPLRTTIPARCRVRPSSTVAVCTRTDNGLHRLLPYCCRTDSIDGKKNAQGYTTLRLTVRNHSSKLQAKSKQSRRRRGGHRALGLGTVLQSSANELLDALRQPNRQRNAVLRNSQQPRLSWTGLTFNHKNKRIV